MFYVANHTLYQNFLLFLSSAGFHVDVTTQKDEETETQKLFSFIQMQNNKKKICLHVAVLPEIHYFRQLHKHVSVNENDNTNRSHRRWTTTHFSFLVVINRKQNIFSVQKFLLRRHKFAFFSKNKFPEHLIIIVFSFDVFQRQLRSSVCENVSHVESFSFVFSLLNVLKYLECFLELGVLLDTKRRKMNWDNGERLIKWNDCSTCQIENHMQKCGSWVWASFLGTSAVSHEFVYFYS
jgi:hypothetical protein